MQPNQPPFTPPTAPPPGGTGNPASKVQGPAIAIIASQVVGILVALAMIVARGPMMAWAARQAANSGQPPPAMSGFTSSPILSIIAILCSGFIIYAMMQMRQLKGFGLAVAGTIMAMLPIVSTCCCLGIPFGIWGLIVLFDPNVRASFQG